MSILIDLKDMPGADLSVTNGMDSVSRGLVKMRFDFQYAREVDGWYILTDHFSPHCVAHGALNRVSKDGIYRCMTCHVGCYLVE